MKKYVAVVVLSIASITAMAADQGGYMAFDLGSATYSDVTVGAGTYPNPGMFRIAGGYHFNPSLAAEFGYTKFGDSTISAGATSGTIVASSFQAVAVGSYPLTQSFDLIGRVGLANNKQTIDVKTNGVVVSSIGASKTSLLFGLGAQYNFNPKLSMRLQYENYGEFGQFGTTGKAMKASTVSLGLVSNF